MAGRYAYFPPFTVDIVELRVWRGTQECQHKRLTPLAIRILIYLTRKQGQIVRHSDLEELLSQPTDDKQGRAAGLARYISRIKKYTGMEMADYIETISKNRDTMKVGGYRFLPPVVFNDQPPVSLEGIVSEVVGSPASGTEFTRTSASVPYPHSLIQSDWVLDEKEFISIAESQPSLHLRGVDLKCKLFPASAWTQSPTQTYTDDLEDEFRIELVERPQMLPDNLLAKLMAELETELRSVDSEPLYVPHNEPEYRQTIQEVYQRLRSERSNAYPRLAGIPKVMRKAHRSVLQVPIAPSKYGVALIREKRIALPTAQKLASCHILNSLAVRIAYVYQGKDGKEWVELQQRQCRKNATFSGAWDVSAAGYIDSQKHGDPSIKGRTSPSQACADELAKELNISSTDLPYRDNYYFFGIGRNDETGQVDILGYCLGSTEFDSNREVSPFVSSYDRCPLDLEAIVECVLEKRRWVPTAILTLILTLESRGRYSRSAVEEIFARCADKLDLRASE